MSLDTTFRDLCARYFPRWRAAPQWTIREGPRAQWRVGTATHRSSEQGYCDLATKTIFINVSWRDLHATIIHETCHAVAGGYHGARWQRRMEQARLRAATGGDTQLAASLAADLASLERPGLRFSASAIYERVHDMLLDVPTATLDQVVNALALDHGMTPDEVRYRYRRLSYWYTRYRRAAAARRADWQQRLEALTR